jgi:small subunit ribosomal protein S2
MAQTGIKELLEAGVHFGHQTRRWNPKMRRYIFGERGGIYLIDLLKTQQLLTNAQDFAAQIAHRGGTVLFVGTKKQARDAVKDVAEAAGMPYVNHRWLGGLLTNFQTISQRIRRLHDLERYEAEGQLALLPTRERLSAEADLAKLRANLGGVKHMQRPPDAMFVIDLKTEVIAVHEAQRLRIPIIGLVDTNCDPDGIDYVVPGNDDAIRSCDIIARSIGDVVREGNLQFHAREEQARQDAAEQQRRAAEEQARREAEAAAAQAAADEAEAAAAAGVEAPQDAAELGNEALQAAVATGGDRAEQEAAEAEVLAEARRPGPSAEAATPQSADTEVAPAQRDNAQGTAPKPAPPANDETPDPASPPETPLTDAVEGSGTTTTEDTSA